MPRLTVLALPLLLAAACGDAGSPGSAGETTPDRTVEVVMRDIVFEPAVVEVQAGETVRFVFRNEGELTHDAFVGDATAQAEHEQHMDDAGGGHGDHGTDAAVTVEPGRTAELVHTFGQAGTLEIGCHQPGHYDAGMKLAVEVMPPAG